MDDPTKSSGTLTATCEPSRAAKIHQTLQWVLKGATEHEIQETITATWPGENPADLLSAVAAHLNDAADVDERTAYGFCVESTRHLYARMVEIGDFCGALRALKQLHDLAKNKPTADEPTSENEGNTIEAAEADQTAEDGA